MKKSQNNKVAEAPVEAAQPQPEAKSPASPPHFKWRLGFYPFNKSAKDKDQDYKVHIW